MSMISLHDDRAASVSEIRLEESDEDLKKLSEYFEKSSKELNMRVQSLLSFNITPGKNILDEPALNLNPKSNTNTESKKEKKPQPKYVPIDLETAKALRELTVSNCVHSFSDDWKRAKFQFRESDTDLAYGLLSEKNGSKGLILSVQTIILKNLILRGYTDINGEEVLNSEWRNKRKILRPNEVERRGVLIESLSQILWKAGEEKSAIVALNSEKNCFQWESTNRQKKSNYVGDGLTEKFQAENGCILFLYDLILSRTIQKVREELQEHALIGDMEDCQIALFNLVISARAVPYLHNDTIYFDSNGNNLEKPMFGINRRNDVGILYWNSTEDEQNRTEVGSMLKTPRNPIWLAILGKNQFAVLFNTNIDLLNNWRLEQSFSLHFYSSLKKQEEEHLINIDSRKSSDVLDIKTALRRKYPHLKFTDDERENEIYKLIISKWPDCELPDTDCKELMMLL